MARQASWTRAAEGGPGDDRWTAREGPRHPAACRRGGGPRRGRRVPQRAGTARHAQAQGRLRRADHGLPQLLHRRTPPPRLPRLRKAVEVEGPAVEKWAEAIAAEHGFVNVATRWRSSGRARSAPRLEPISPVRRGGAVRRRPRVTCGWSRMQIVMEPRFSFARALSENYTKAGDRTDAGHIVSSLWRLPTCPAAPWASA
jgi:hypothetical protein